MNRRENREVRKETVRERGGGALSATIANVGCPSRPFKKIIPNYFKICFFFFNF